MHFRRSQVPLIATVYFLVSFKNFEVLDDGQAAALGDAFFKVPAAGCTKVTAERMLGSLLKPRGTRNGSGGEDSALGAFNL